MTVRTAGHETCHHRTYLLSCDQFEALLARAGGRCELCSVPASDVVDGKLRIDHEHRIGLHAVRGLLCPTCNAHMRRVDSGERPMSWEVAAYVLLSGNVLPPGWAALQPSTATGHPRTVRIPKDIWTEFGEVCGQVQSNRTEALVGFMEWITNRPGARKPKRPPAVPQP